MAGETSGPGPSEQEIRMVALERKFDELLSFVQLIAKRNTDDENQRKEDDKDTSEAEPEGHSNTNATPPRPPTPPKPEGKDSQLDSKIDSLEEKIRLIQGLNSFGNTDFSSMSWFPNMTVPPKFKAPEFEKYNGRGDPMIHLQMYCRKMAPYADNEPLLIQTFQDTLTGNAAEWYSQLKKISHWKELADTFLAQYGFNSQIAPDRFDLQRMEKKSNETFREYAQRWREKAARARPPLDEREMIKIFVDTLKNPYFDRMMGLQMQFFVDLIPVGDRIEDALKTKKIVDMTALMALAEQAAKKAPTKRKEGDVQMIGRNNGRPRQVLPTFTMQPIQPRPIQAPAPTQKSLISPIVPKPYNGPQRRDFNPNSACDFHFGEVGHTVENCGQLRHRVQDLIDHGVLKFEGLPNITTNPLPKHPEGGVNMVEVEEGNEESIAWRRLFYTLEKQKHITPSSRRKSPNLMEKWDRWGEKKYHQKEVRQPDDPSDFDWYAEINLDDIVEDEMDLDNLQDEEADWGYFMEDDTDEWRDVDFTEFFQFPCLIVPPGFVTPEFEIFYEDGDPEVHLQKYGEKMALHLENELLMISVFPESLSKQAAAWFYQLRNLTGWDDLKKEKSQVKAPPPNLITTAVAEEEYAGPMVEGLSIHTIAGEEDSTTTPPTRHCQQGEEVKTWTCVPLLQRVSSSNEITRKTSNDPHVSKIDNKTDCSLDNIDNSDEEIELPSDILEALERQDEGSKPNIEELEIVNLAIRGPRHRHSGPQDSRLKPECKPVKASTATGMKPEVILKIKEEVEKQLKAATNVVFSFMDGFSGYNQIKMAEEDKSKTAFVTHWGTFVYDVMPFGLKNAGATYQRAMVTLFHDMIHHEIEVYVDDMIAKSRTAQDHLTDLRKLVPATEEVSAQIEPEQDVPSFYTSQSKKHPWAACWDNKTRLGRKEQAIYYLSKKFTEPETRYLLVEKTCCALAWASKKLRQYMLYYTTWLVSRMDPIKRSRDKAIADYLADYPSEQLELMDSEFPDEDDVMTVDFTLTEQQTLSEAELARSCMHRRPASSFRNSVLMNWKSSETLCLIVSQTNGEWQAPGSQAHPVSTIHQPANPKVQLVEGDDVRPLRIETRDIPAYCVCIEECMNVEAEIDDKPCSFLSGEILYKRTHDATLLRCVDAEEANRLIQEMHAGLMGAHANGPFLARKIMRAGYYWLTMERDCIRHVQTCHKCQMYQNSKNAPPQYLHTMASPWPFSAWGMDVIGAITPKASNGHEFILVTRFVKNNIICRYGMPEMLITDNASNLNNRMMDQLCQQFKIQHHNSAPYRPKMNGAVEAANKNVKKILSKMTETYKDWHEHLPYALCAYRTSVRTSVGATPYSLVYGMEAVLPVEVEIPSLRILSQTQLEEAEWAQARYEQLNFIDEKRLAALCHGQLYQRRIERAYNKKARPRTFQPGDLVLKKRNMALSDPRGKFAPSYEGPYVVKKAFSGGAIILADMDGEEFRSPINSDSVIKYHV
uniref:Integrase catalytic domain-containing protein n=1 Tax=Fagus sylvatica TaxID=28930 RepID=A0A2N9FMM5_FAGSY